MGKRAVFLDRDGTLIEHYDYLTDPSQVQLLPTTVAALRRLRERGFLLVMVTNQSGVARGILTEQTLIETHDRLRELLSEQGTYLDQIYYCPYHPEGAIEKYRRESEMRKPAPGMFKLAAEEMDIDLGQSWAVGDDDRDILAGQAAGCRTVLMETHNASPLVHRGESQADFRAMNLLEAANVIARHSDRPRADEAPPAAEAEATTEHRWSEGQSTEMVGQSTSDVADEGAAEQLGQTGQAERPTEQEEADDAAVAERRAKAVEARTPEGPSAADQGQDKQGSGGSDALLGQILRELKRLNREHRFAEFSVAKLLAGLVQMLVFLCLILAFWFGSGPEADSAKVHSTLMTGLILQVLTLTLMMMSRS